MPLWTRVLETYAVSRRSVRTTFPRNCRWTLTMQLQLTDRELLLASCDSCPTHSVLRPFHGTTFRSLG